MLAGPKEGPAGAMGPPDVGAEEVGAAETGTGGDIAGGAGGGAGDDIAGGADRGAGADRRVSSEFPEGWAGVP